jgi:hypothetical protein
MKKSVIGLLILLVLALSTIAYADVVVAPTFFVKPEAINGKIKDPIKDYADFIIKIANKGAEEDTFKLLYLDDPKWSYQVLPDPINKEIKVASGEEGEIHILVKGNVVPGTYAVKVSIQSANTKNIIDNVMRITVGDIVAPKVTKPEFDVEVSVPSQMDPNGAYNVLVTLNNKNERLLEDVSVKLKSNLLTDSTLITVTPSDSKTISFAVVLFDNVPPQQDQLNIQVLYQDEEYYNENYNFEVIEYLPPFDTQMNVEKSFLKQERVLTITNLGNAKKTDVVKIQASLKDKFFSRSDPKFEFVKDESGYFMNWPISLASQESTEIKMTTSYRLLIIPLLLLVALIIYNMMYSNPLIIKKKIRQASKEIGALTNVSVIIYLKNRSKQPIRNVRLVERVSKMIQLKQDSFSGSLHPSKMHNRDSEGSLLEYRFAEIAPGDTRTVTYTVYSKLHVFGPVTIKPTVAEFQLKNGKHMKASSSPLSMITEEPAEKKKHELFMPHKKK